MKISLLLGLAVSGLLLVACGQETPPANKPLQASPVRAPEPPPPPGGGKAAPELSKEQLEKIRQDLDKKKAAGF